MIDWIISKLGVLIFAVLIFSGLIYFGVWEAQSYEKQKDKLESDAISNVQALIQPGTEVKYELLNKTILVI